MMRAQNSTKFAEAHSSPRYTSTRRHWAISKSSGVRNQRYHATPNATGGAASKNEKIRNEYKSMARVYRGSPATAVRVSSTVTATGPAEAGRYGCADSEQGFGASARLTGSEIQRGAIWR